MALMLKVDVGWGQSNPSQICPNNLLQNPDFSFSGVDVGFDAFCQGFVNNWRGIDFTPHIIQLDPLGNTYCDIVISDASNTMACLRSRPADQIAITESIAQQGLTFSPDPLVTYFIDISARLLDCGRLNSFTNLDVYLLNSNEFPQGCANPSAGWTPVVSQQIVNSQVNWYSTQNVFENFSITNPTFNAIYIRSWKPYPPTEINQTVLGLENVVLACQTTELTDLIVNNTYGLIYAFGSVNTSTVSTFTEYLWTFTKKCNSQIVFQSTNSNPSYTFTEGGQYEICLDIRDNFGCCGSRCEILNVPCSPPMSVFTSEVSCVNNENIVSFTQPLGSCLTYLWNFGDNSTSTTQNPIHEYIKFLTRIYFPQHKIQIVRLISILIIILINSFEFSVSAQKNDHNWVMGHYGFGILEQIENDTAKEFTPFTLNFNTEPMKIEYYTYRRFMMDATNSNYSKNNGDLYCYTNGMQLNGPDDQPIQGGDTINYNNYWRGKVRELTGEKYGFSQFQGNIILPISQQGKELLYVFNTIFDTQKSESIGIFYSIVDVSCNNGKGCVIDKDIILINAELKDGYLQACKHANGRDWWLIAISDDNTTYYTFLLDHNEVKLVNTQNIGKENINYSAGNATFSHSGDKYAVNDGRYWDSIGVISIFDFDRCSGLLSNPFFDTLVIPEASVGQGLAFSPDDRYLYANNYNDLYQYDMKDLNKPRTHLATYDGFQDPTDWPGIFTTQFGFWGYGPDGRLYNVSGSASSRYMHVMDYPNEGGAASSFRQHAIKIPNNPWSIPNFPHYRLGPLDGSPCDTLGLDNHPIAKYRYEADSIDYLRLRFTDLSYFRPETWSWDFGDGSPRVSTQSPYHTFPKSGTYLVCLTVSNENSSHTVCRTITLGTSSSEDDMSVSRADISLFPNPVQDYLLLTLGEYVPAHGQVRFYDVTGRSVITQRIYYGQNSVDMSALPAGMYVWKMMDGKREIKEGKLVKI